MSAIAVVGGLLSLAACNDAGESFGSRSEPGSDSIVVGDVRGEDLVVHEAIAVRVDGPSAHGVAIILTDRPGMCGALRDDAALATANTLTLFVPDALPTEKGSIDARSWISGSEATFTAWEPGCEEKTYVSTLGEVALDAVELEPGQRTSGTFDVAFDADRIGGKFAALYCDVGATSPNPLDETARCD